MGSGWATHHGEAGLGFCGMGCWNQPDPQEPLLPFRGLLTPTPPDPQPCAGAEAGAPPAPAAPRRHGDQMVLSGARRFSAQGPGAASCAMQKTPVLLSGGGEGGNRVTSGSVDEEERKLSWRGSRFLRCPREPGIRSQLRPGC